MAVRITRWSRILCWFNDLCSNKILARTNRPRKLMIEPHLEKNLRRSGGEQNQGRRIKTDVCITDHIKLNPSAPGEMKKQCRSFVPQMPDRIQILTHVSASRNSLWALTFQPAEQPVEQKQNLPYGSSGEKRSSFKLSFLLNIPRLWLICLPNK